MDFVVITSTKDMHKLINGSVYGIKHIEKKDDKVIWHFHSKKFLDKAIEVFANSFDYVYVPGKEY